MPQTRQSPEGSLKVTGRDVPENEYALKVIDGTAWQLDGDEPGRRRGPGPQARRTAAGLGDISARLLAVIREHPEGIRAADLQPSSAKDVYQYLGGLTEAGRIDKVARGLYVP